MPYDIVHYMHIDPRCALGIAQSIGLRVMAHIPGVDMLVHAWYVHRIVTLLRARDTRIDNNTLAQEYFHTSS